MAGPDSSGGTASTDDPVRAVFRTAWRDMLLLLAVLAVVGVPVGAWVAGLPGVWGALLALGITLLFSGTTIVSMLATAHSSAAVTGGVILGAWVVKMGALVVLFAALRDLDFFHRVVFVVVLLVGVLGSALLDYRAVISGRVPYVEPRQN